MEKLNHLALLAKTLLARTISLNGQSVRMIGRLRQFLPVLTLTHLTTQLMTMLSRIHSQLTSLSLTLVILPLSSSPPQDRLLTPFLIPSKSLSSRPNTLLTPNGARSSLILSNLAISFLVIAAAAHTLTLSCRLTQQIRMLCWIHSMDRLLHQAPLILNILSRL
jgi:hypothetical protein